MGNPYSRGSYEKDPLIRHLWKVLRAIPVFPINPNLEPLRVLTKHSDGYRDVGSVASLSKTGDNRNWLQAVQNPTMLQRINNLLNKSYFQKKSIGKQLSHVFSGDHGAVAKFLVGDASVAAWFKRASSMEVHIPECWVHEYRIENWDEMLRHFDPDLKKNSSILGKPGWNGKRNLFIVQRVVLVSSIVISAKCKTHSGLNLQTPQVWSGGAFEAKFSFRSADTFEFSVSATKANRKLPIAFSGYWYTYDRLGALESEHGKPTRILPAAAARRQWLCRR